VRSSYHNTTNYKISSNAEKLVLVRSGVLYGLSFETVKQEKNTYNSGITSIPTFIFINNNTQCFLDFTNQTNQDVEAKIKNFFSKIAPLTTINIHNAFFTNTNTEERADLSGQFVFSEFFNGIVKLNVTSVNQLASGVVRYDKKYFEEIPLIVASALTTTETQNITVIRNLFGSNTKNSFNYLGIQVGDFISFSEVEKKYEVIEITTDPNGVETVKVNGIIDAEEYIDVKVLVNAFVRCKDKYTEEPNINETQTGACVQSQNGVIINCMENHTASQCRFRSSAIDNIDSTISFGSFCVTPETETSVQKTNTDKLIEITSLIATNLAIANTNTTNVAGPINRGGNTKNAFYGRT